GLAILVLLCASLPYMSIADMIRRQGSDNMRIVICDDEVSMVQILEEKIKKLLPDAVIDKYLSGDELIASGSKPDILFLDIQMPGMDGMETAKVLRQDNENMILIFVNNFREKYKERIGESYIIHPRNLIVKDGIICIPPYMTMNI
uniref:LytR/AlgR family response regulator transcription factor n=1 Tax=Lachnospira eligens TaxID=39485 RepID=UPI0040266246